MKKEQGNTSFHRQTLLAARVAPLRCPILLTIKSITLINQVTDKSKANIDKQTIAVFFSLLYEDIFLHRDLCNLCQNDPDTLTEESIVTIKEKYKKKLIGSISDENTLLKQEVARLRQKTKEIEDSFKAKTKQAKEEASKCATAKYDKVFKQCKITVYVCLLISFAIGLTGTIYNAILQPSNVWGYIILGIAVIVGISTLMKNSLEKTNLLFRMARKISYNTKNKEYDAAYARLMH
jgi:regulator of replication initiation timing